MCDVEEICGVLQAKFGATGVGNEVFGMIWNSSATKIWLKTVWWPKNLNSGYIENLWRYASLLSFLIFRSIFTSLVREICTET
jgi:hypothetical protein